MALSGAGRDADDFPAIWDLIFDRLESDACASVGGAALPLASCPSDEALDLPGCVFPLNICVQEAKDRAD